MAIGDLKLSYTDADGTVHTITLGFLTSISESFRKSVSSYPLVSMSQDDCFAVESGSSFSYTIGFKHIDGNTEYEYTQPYGQNVQTSSLTTAGWYERVTTFIDRWQARTNGFKLTYTPSPKSGGYNPSFYAINNVNGFVRSIERKYIAGDITVIEGTMVFEVGTMYIETDTPTPKNTVGYLQERYNQSNKKENWQILMSDSTGLVWYPLLYGDNDTCISSYSLTGGSEDPFEHLEMVLSRNKLAAQFPELVDDIEYGKNRIIVNAVGRSNMTIYDGKMNSKSKEWTIKAYGDSEKLRGSIIDVDGEYYPYEWILELLTTGRYGMQYNEGTTLLTSSMTDRTGPGDRLVFPAGTNVWYILQVCAMYLRCKIFFANNCVYLIDTTNAYDPDETVMRDYGEIDLHPSRPDDPTAPWNAMYGRVTGNISTGHEGSNTIGNVVVIKCSDGDGNSITVPPIKDEPSMGVYGIRNMSDMTVKELIQGGYTNEDTQISINYTQATIFGNNMLAYHREPQESVTFTTKEVRRWELPTGIEGGVDPGLWWVPTFMPCSRLDAIVDNVDEIDVTNISYITGEAAPNLLTLSKFEHNYPENTTTYTFGKIENITLSDNTSKILTALNSV